MGDAQAQVILGAKDIGLMIGRMTLEILEVDKGLHGLGLVGIQTRGVPLAHRIAREIERIEGRAPPIGALDITLYRDDFDRPDFDPEVRETAFPFEIDGARIVLVDDVLHTGRTVRAAMDEIMDFGRPALVQLAVLIDRGGRELPIAPTFVGKKLGTRRDEVIRVRLSEVDGEDDSVMVLTRPEPVGERQ